MFLSVDEFFFRLVAAGKKNEKSVKFYGIACDFLAFLRLVYEKG